jgi:hypothetical protein
MSLLDENESEGILSLEGVEDAVEPELIDAGDYQLEITKAEFQRSKAGDPMIRVLFKAHDTGKTNPNIITSYFMLPAEGDDAELKNRKNVQMKRFLRGINYSLEDGKLDLAKLPGLIGEANIGIDPAKDGYEASNRIKRWNEPR